MNAGFKNSTQLRELSPLTANSTCARMLIFVWRHWMFIGGGSGVAADRRGSYLSCARNSALHASTQVLLRSAKKLRERRVLPIFAFYDTTSSMENQLAILQIGCPSAHGLSIKEKLVPASPSSTSQPARDEMQRKKIQLIQDGIVRLRGCTGSKAKGQAPVLDISITWTDPVKAGQLANAVADAFVVDQLDARFDSAKRASGWLSDRIVELRQQLRSSGRCCCEFSERPWAHSNRL